MLCDAYFPGLHYQENLLTKYYIKHGHSVVIIASTFNDIFKYYLDEHDNNLKESISVDNNLTVYRKKFKFNFLNKLRYLNGVRNILNIEKPDLIFVHDIHLNIIDAISYLKKNRDCKMILDYHCDYSNSGKNWVSRNILHRVIRNSFLKISDKFINKYYPVVPSSRKFLNEIYSIPIDRMEILPLGADTDLAAKISNEVDKISLLKKINIDPDDFVIFTGGKLNTLKKTELLIDAVNKFNHDRVKLIIAGGFSQNDEYSEFLLDKLNNCSNARYVGWLPGDEVYKYMAISTIAVFPASQSILWQQAITMGLPLIVGETSDQSIEYLNLRNNISSIKESDISSDEIFNQINSYLNSEEKLIMAARGADFVKNNILNYDNIILKTLDVFN